jgi:S-layer protein
VKDASTGTADVVNIVTNQDGNLSAGTVTIANVETVNITADDKVVDASGAYDEFGNGIADGKDDNNSAQSISLTADTAATVNVAGSADVTLDLVSSSVVTAVNASTMTGKFELVADGKSTGTTVTGGAGADTLTAYGSNDVLIGGAGNDKLTATSLTTLTGGAGNDTFVLPAAVAATEYSTITDLSAGDVIDTAATTFATSKIVLASNSTFAQYLDAAVNAASSVTSDVGSAVNGQWFQFNGDTFLVIDGYTDSSTDTDNAGYLATEDSVIAITGLVNLSTAVFNATTGDLTIA